MTDSNLLKSVLGAFTIVLGATILVKFYGAIDFNNTETFLDVLGILGKFLLSGLGISLMTIGGMTFAISFSKMIEKRF